MDYRLAGSHPILQCCMYNSVHKQDFSSTFYNTKQSPVYLLHMSKINFSSFMHLVGSCTWATVLVIFLVCLHFVVSTAMAHFLKIMYPPLISACLMFWLCRLLHIYGDAIFSILYFDAFLHAFFTVLLIHWTAVGMSIIAFVYLFILFIYSAACYLTPFNDWGDKNNVWNPKTDTKTTESANHHILKTAVHLLFMLLCSNKFA